MHLSRVMVSIALAAMVVYTTGCNNNLKDDNERLYAENVQLHDEMNASYEALDACEQQRSELQNEVSRLRMENQNLAATAAKPQQQPKMDTGFGGITGVQGEFRAGEVVARVEGDVLFDSGQVTLKSQAKRTLDDIASVIKSKYSGKTIRIEGHTDSDPIKKSAWKTNDRLSCERAMAVKTYLESKGIDSSMMYVAGLGLTKPMDTKAKSRRVEIVVMLQ